MAQTRPKEPFILQDRLLLTALLFGSSGYIIVGSWPGVMLLVAAFMMATIWAFRTAASYPRLGFRLLATVLFLVLGAFLTVYVSVHQGIIR